MVAAVNGETIQWCGNSGLGMQLLTPCRIERVDGWVLTSGHPYSVDASAAVGAAASELSAAKALVGKASMLDEAAAAILMIYRAMGQRTK